MDTVAVDCLILGGGLSGLWLLNVLRKAGYSTLLVHDNRELGGLQSLNSAGMIHGGARVGANLINRIEQLQDMPAIWENCLRGSGEMDLRGVRILSPEQHLWGPGGWRNRASLLAAAANTSGKIRKLGRDHFPSLLRSPGFRGDVYRIEHPVIDCVSLLEELARPHGDCIYQAGQQDVHIQTDDLHVSKAVFVRKGKVQLRIHPRQVFLTAGSGNAALLQDIGVNQPLMERRPIHMVCIHHPELPEFHGHCFTDGRRPRLTISTHRQADGSRLWYIAGTIAESGASRDETLQIQAVKAELQALLPWQSLQGARFRGFIIDRIHPSGTLPWRPVQACVRPFGNNWLVWPTRLALAPNAGHQVMAGLAAAGFEPSLPQPGALPMEKPAPGRPLWDRL
ncbi:MAG TPA: FAD-dependent oxidoreductase [Fluviicoccus sp.]|nr:FAD-dependent oxidoreductase [Fluviicoccus sp.]